MDDYINVHALGVIDAYTYSCLNEEGRRSYVLALTLVDNTMFSINITQTVFDAFQSLNEQWTFVDEYDYEDDLPF